MTGGVEPPAEGGAVEGWEFDVAAVWGCHFYYLLELELEVWDLCV